MTAKSDWWWAVKSNLPGILSRQDEELIGKALYKLTITELIIMDILLCELNGKKQADKDRD